MCSPCNEYLACSLQISWLADFFFSLEWSPCCVYVSDRQRCNVTAEPRPMFAAYNLSDKTSPKVEGAWRSSEEIINVSVADFAFSQGNEMITWMALTRSRTFPLYSVKCSGGGGWRELVHKELRCGLHPRKLKANGTLTNALHGLALDNMIVLTVCLKTNPLRECNVGGNAVFEVVRSKRTHSRFGCTKAMEGILPFPRGRVRLNAKN